MNHNRKDQHLEVRALFPKRYLAFTQRVKQTSETLKDVKDTLREGNFMVKLDRKDAYFSIPLQQNSKEICEIYLGRQLLRISMPDV